MSANELEVQPAQIVEVGRAVVKPSPLIADLMQEEYTQDPLDDEPPKTKSGVRLKEIQALVSGRVSCKRSIIDS